jgi:hypothetical protein
VTGDGQAALREFRGSVAVLVEEHVEEPLQVPLVLPVDLELRLQVGIDVVPEQERVGCRVIAPAEEVEIGVFVLLRADEREKRIVLLIALPFSSQSDGIPREAAA